ncbi:MAG: OmpA family protein [Gammaproteobacteria bacterium]|nr:OmpA family protein [Gammaproteobacteria bacterium]
MKRDCVGLLALVLLYPGAASSQSEAGSDLADSILDLEFKTVDLDFATQEVAGATQDLALEETDTEIRIDLAADVLFAFDSAELQPQAAATLQQAAAVIRERATGTVRIEGHTDAKGDDAYNQALSERRANAVRDWFVNEGGLSDLSFATRGFGESVPLAPNAKPDGTDDPEGRQKNRRVEIRVEK